MAGTVVANRFELGRVAGRGGMATVYQARDRATDGPVALKIVEGRFADTRFEREATLLARLAHPGIVKYVAHGRVDDERLYLAMEWLDGVPLDEHLKAASMPLADAIALAVRIAHALAAAHDRGVVHRDVKPSNVILRDGRAGEAVLVDFGIARLEHATRAVTATGMAIGTPAYMAPEQVRGERDVDARADVFSLGCVLFECLAGRPPFAGDHAVAVLAKVLLETAPRLASLRPEVPRALDDLVASMLEKSRDARPPAMTEVMARLEAIATAEVDDGAGQAMPLVIGSSEQRLVSVLLARPNDRAPSSADALAETEEHLFASGARDATTSYLGVRVQRLADGTFVGILTADGPEAPARVVACALAFERELEGVTIAVGTGRAKVDGFVPVGDAIDGAARILAEASSEGGVWICPTTRAMVDGRFDVSEQSKVRGAKPPRERSRTLLGRATPCVGRDRELALLEATFDECVSEPIARAVLVVAPAGIGKSRLQRELVARVGGCDVWLGLADPLMEAAPFAFVGDVLRRVFGVVDGEPIESRRGKIVAHVSELGIRDADRVARRLGEVSGTPFDDGHDDALRAARRDPTLLAEQISEAFVSFVVASLGRRPHLVVLEDVHWADAASLRLLGAALARARDAPLLIVALARPTVDEVHPNLWQDHRCQRIVLEPLLRKAAERLARSVLGDDADVSAIVRRADGNALFVEELARAWAEGRAHDDLPPTIAAVTEARLASLPSDARRVLRAASVFGERFWKGGVARLIGGRAATRLDESLSFLEDREIVSLTAASRFEGEREYVFRHAVVRDVAYAMLTPEDRLIGHALAGEWLETRIDDGALLAYHFGEGQRPNDAARWHVRAAEQALAAHELDAVFRCVARAEACGASGAHLGRARLVEADAQLWLGDNAAAARAAGAAQAALERGSEKWFAAIGVGAPALGKLGDLDGLLRIVDDLEATAASDERSGRARAVARARAAIQLSYLGEVARANALLDGCANEPGASNDGGVLAWIHEALVERALAVGEPVHPSVARRGRDLRFELGDRRGACGQWAAETQLLSLLGAWDEAVAVLEELVRVAGEASGTIGTYVGIIRATRAAVGGDYDALRAFAAELESRGLRRVASVCWVAAAQLRYRDGSHAEARSAAERALDIGGALGYRTVALAVLARCQVAAGDVGAALETSELALDASRKGVALNGLADVHLARVEALEAAGRIEEAHRALENGFADLHAKARDLAEYRDVFLSSWNNPALMELAKERGISAP